MIERTVKIITVTINTSRPGIIIGKGGAEVDIHTNTMRVKEKLEKLNEL